MRLLEPTAGFNVPVVAWFRSGKVANHVESVYGHPADKVRRYPGYSKLKADRYYIVSHGRGPRFTITNQYALALFGRGEVSGSSPAAHLEKVGSWDDAVAVLRQRALAWRDSASTRRTHGTPTGGGCECGENASIRGVDVRRRGRLGRSNPSLPLRHSRWWLTSVAPQTAPWATRRTRRSQSRSTSSRTPRTSSSAR